MAESLKAKNQKWVVAIIAANALAFYLAAHFGPISTDGVAATVSEWKSLLPVGGGLLVGTLFNGLVNRDYKARLVFWRWSNPLPSREAFSKHARFSQRVDIHFLEERYAPLPSEHSDQTLLWYKIYRSHAEEPAVIQAQVDYLLMRDWCALSAVFLAMFGIIGLALIDPVEWALSYVAILMIQYILTMVAARNYGISLVRNVLAIESAS